MAPESTPSGPPSTEPAPRPWTLFLRISHPQMASRATTRSWRAFGSRRSEVYRPLRPLPGCFRSSRWAYPTLPADISPFAFGQTGAARSSAWAGPSEVCISRWAAGMQRGGGSPAGALSTVWRQWYSHRTNLWRIGAHEHRTMNAAQPRPWASGSCTIHHVSSVPCASYLCDVLVLVEGINTDRECWGGGGGRSLMGRSGKAVPLAWRPA